METPPLTYTTGFYSFFKGDQGENDRQSARAQASREALDLIREAASTGRLIDVLVALRTANQITVEATRRWISEMISFTKLWRPSFEASETLFPPGSSEAVVTYDSNLKICVLYARLLGENIPGSFGLTPDTILSQAKLKLATDAYKSPEVTAALSKLTQGQALNNTDRQALSSLFKSVKESLSSLNASFAASTGSPGSGNTSSPVSLDEQALVAMLTQTNNASNRFQDRVLEQTQHLFDPSRFM